MGRCRIVRGGGLLPMILRINCWRAVERNCNTLLRVKKYVRLLLVTIGKVSCYLESENDLTTYARFSLMAMLQSA